MISGRHPLQRQHRCLSPLALAPRPGFVGQGSGEIMGFPEENDLQMVVF